MCTCADIIQIKMGQFFQGKLFCGLRWKPEGTPSFRRGLQQLHFPGRLFSLERGSPAKAPSARAARKLHSLAKLSGSGSLYKPPAVLVPFLGGARRLAWLFVPGSSVSFFGGGATSCPRATFQFRSFQGSESFQETIKNPGKQRSVFEKNDG